VRERESEKANWRKRVRDEKETFERMYVCMCEGKERERKKERTSGRE